MTLRAVTTCAGVLLLAGPALAQPRPGGVGGTPRPAFSPYLNLVRQGGSPTLNYYGLVRPEIQAQQSIQMLQGSVAANQQAIGDVQGGLNDMNRLPVTGHAATFLNYQRFFLTGGAVVTGANTGAVTTGGTTFSNGMTTQNRNPTAPSLPTRPQKSR